MGKRISKLKPATPADLEANGLIPVSEGLFSRVAAILDRPRGSVVRAVNNEMVLAYWLIGREIVAEIQQGAGRAEYGQQVIKGLSEQLTKRYGEGYSITSLSYFRQFYLAFADRS